MLSAEVAARVDLLLRSMPPPGLVAGGGLCSPNSSIGALMVESLALAAGCGSERVRAGDAVAVAVGGDRADLLLPSGWQREWVTSLEVV